MRGPPPKPAKVGGGPLFCVSIRSVQTRAKKTRRSLLNAAVALFNRNGYARTSIADIVAATEITKGAFHYHFTEVRALEAPGFSRGEESAADTTWAVSRSHRGRGLSEWLEIVSVC